MSKFRLKNRMKIRTKLVTYFLILLSIPILILGFYTYTQSRRNFEAQSAITIENNLDSIVSELDALANWEGTYLKYLAYNVNFRTLLSQRHVDTVQLAMELNRTIEPSLWYYITSDNYVKEIEIFTPKVEDHVGSFIKNDKNVRQEAWYQSCLRNNQPQWFCQNGELFLARNILDAATSSSSIGVMKITIFYSTFMEPLKHPSYLGNGVLVLDCAGEAIYKRPTLEGEIDLTVIENIQSNHLEDTNLYLLRSRLIPATGWTVFYYVARSQIVGQIHNIILKTLQVVACVIVIALILVSAFSNSLSRRILRLKKSAEEVAAGNLKLDLHTEDTDEIGVVINSFGNMTRQLDQLINQIYKMQLEERAVELKALQSQINPHFLYNALSSIKWKAIKQKNNDISELTGLLAKYYRTSLNNGEILTTVESEIENIQAYIELQRHMHDVPFVAEYHISPDTLHLQMLNFLLQPIVENAFKHGIDYTDETGDGRIVIEAHMEGEYLIFIIRNNGPEINSEKMRDILEKPGKRYGVFNIQERVHLYYGEECGLSAEVDENGYTAFTLKILKKCTIPSWNTSVK